MARWNHERIIGMLCSFDIEHPVRGGSMSIVFPFAERGDLRAFLRMTVEPVWASSGWPISSLEGRLSDWRFAVYTEVVGLAEAVAFLHNESRGTITIHRDIKPANILIHERKFKLSDFGLSQFKAGEETSKTTWMLGTPMYEPPERNDSDVFGRARDVWALGCVFFELSLMMGFAFHDHIKAFYTTEDDNIIDLFETKRVQFSGAKDTKIYHKTIDLVIAWIQSFEDMDDDLHKTITHDGILAVAQDMLNLNPEERSSAEAAALRLRSSWTNLQQDPRYLPKAIMSNPGKNNVRAKDRHLPPLSITPREARVPPHVFYKVYPERPRRRETTRSSTAAPFESYTSKGGNSDYSRYEPINAFRDIENYY